MEQKDLEQQLKDKQLRLSQCTQAISKHQKITSRLRIDWQQAKNVVEELQDALDRDAVEEGRLDALKEQLTEAEDEKTTHESSYENSVMEKDRLFKSLKSLKERMANFDSTIEEAKAKLLKAEQKAAHRAHLRENALYEKNKALEAVERALQDHQDTQRARNDKESTVENFREQAGQISSRVTIDKGETCGVIEEKLNKMNADLRKAEKRSVTIRVVSELSLIITIIRIGGNAVRIAAEARRTSDALHRARAEVESLETLVQVGNVFMLALHLLTYISF